MRYEPVYAKHGVEVWHGDSLEILEFLSWKQKPLEHYNSVDLLLTDPPYGIDYHSLRGKESIKTDALEETNELAKKFFDTTRGLLKAGSTYYIFTGTLGPGPRLWETLIEDDKSNRSYSTRFRAIQNLVWDKQHFGTGAFFRYQWERILFGCYGEKPTTWNGEHNNADVLRYPRIVGSGMVHPTEKPAELIRHLIRLSTNRGDMVLEPFGGSGVVVDCCRELQRRCVSIEIDEGHIATQIERLENPKSKQVSMF